jgi:hypothetical protein
MFAIAVIIIISAAVVIGDMNAYPAYEDPTPIEQSIDIEDVYQDNKADILNEGNIPHYDAEELMNDLSDSFNDVKQEYKIRNSIKNKYIKISGEVDKVNYNTIDGCYIVFRQDKKGFHDGWIMITCNFYDKTEKKKLLNLHAGDNVTVLGLCSNDFLTGPSLVDCYFLD